MSVPTIEEGIPGPVPGLLRALAGAGGSWGSLCKGQEGPGPSMVGQGMVASPAEVHRPRERWQGYAGGQGGECCRCSPPGAYLPS